MQRFWRPVGAGLIGPDRPMVGVVLKTFYNVQKTLRFRIRGVPKRVEQVSLALGDPVDGCNELEQFPSFCR